MPIFRQEKFVNYEARQVKRKSGCVVNNVGFLTDIDLPFVDTSDVPAPNVRLKKSRKLFGLKKVETKTELGTAIDRMSSIAFPVVRDGH